MAIDQFCAVWRTHAHTAHVFSATDGEGKFSNLKSQPEAAPLKPQKRSPADASEFKRGNKPNALPMQREK